MCPDRASDTAYLVRISVCGVRKWNITNKQIGKTRMKIPSFKDLIKKLSLIRADSALLLPIGIGLVAIVLFIPNQLLSSRLKQQIENDSISKAKRLQSIEPVPREQLE